MDGSDRLTVGEVAERSGVAASALRFYESRGLISAERTEGNQRRFRRSTLRRVAVIRAARAVGISLERIGEALDTFPKGRAPTRRDWARLSRVWREDLEQRIAELEGLRDRLVNCIGCGCLSLEVCALYNPDDQAGGEGSGPRYLTGRRASG